MTKYMTDSELERCYTKDDHLIDTFQDLKTDDELGTVVKVVIIIGILSIIPAWVAFKQFLGL